MEYNDEEKNNLNYELALRYDKRTYFEYYLSLLKTKHPFIFSFCYSKDYNSKIIKLDLFFISFIMNYVINALFLMIIPCIKYMKMKAHLIFCFNYLKLYILH